MKNLNYNELTPVQKHVVRAMHYIYLSKNTYRLGIKRSPIQKLYNSFLFVNEYSKLFKFRRLYTLTKAWIWKRAYENECLRLAEIPKRIPGYTNERARREAKEVVDYVRGEYRRMINDRTA